MLTMLTMVEIHDETPGEVRLVVHGPAAEKR